MRTYDQRVDEVTHLVGTQAKVRIGLSELREVEGRLALQKRAIFKDIILPFASCTLEPFCRSTQSSCILNLFSRLKLLLERSFFCVRSARCEQTTKV